MAGADLFQHGQYLVSPNSQIFTEALNRKLVPPFAVSQSTSLRREEVPTFMTSGLSVVIVSIVHFSHGRTLLTRLDT